jgi:copper chaperone CopZ
MTQRTGQRTRRAHLAIDGMVAVHAVRAVYTAFAGVPGVTHADVQMGTAVVEHDGTVTREMIEAAVALAGCRVTAVREERALPLL